MKRQEEINICNKTALISECGALSGETYSIRSTSSFILVVKSVPSRPRPRFIRCIKVINVVSSSYKKESGSNIHTTLCKCTCIIRFVKPSRLVSPPFSRYVNKFLHIRLLHQETQLGFQRLDSTVRLMGSVSLLS